MATIPLYDASILPAGAWRRMIAPGGSQRWCVDGIGDDGQVVSITFFDGRWADSTYRDRYRRFIAAPTRRDPPRPSEYRAVELLRISRHGAPVRRLFATAPADFQAASDQMNVHIGEHRLEPEGDGRCAITGPDVDLRLTAGGIDGSLRRIEGTLLGGPIAGRGVVHDLLAAGPPTTTILSYQMLGDDRAITGSLPMPTAYPQSFAIGELIAENPIVLLDDGAERRLRYSVRGRAADVVLAQIAR